MNKEFIEKQLKLSKRQSKDERYDYLCSEFNAINYCVNLEKYTNKLQQENQKYKEVINKAIKHINKYESIKAYYEYIDEDGYDEYNYDEDFKKELLDILKEVKTC